MSDTPATPTSTRRVVVITGAGGALGASLSSQFAGEANTDLVLSDVSEAGLAATVGALPAECGALETVLALNGIGVAPQGDKFLVVTQLTNTRSSAPEMITGSCSWIPC